MPIKLNIGGGKGHPRVPGWTVVDLREGADVRLDIARDPLPFADNSADIIFTSHTLEHIPPQRLGHVLAEFARVIRPAHEGGLVRIAVPDIALACRAYVEGDERFFREAEVTPFDRTAPIGGLLMSWFYSTSAVGSGHVHCFDAEYLAHWLRRCGFREAARCSYRGSSLPELRGEAFDRHPRESLFMEARKVSGAAA